MRGILILLCVGGLMVAVIRSQPAAPPSAPQPAPSIDLRGYFAQAPDVARARHDAHQLAHFCQFLSTYVAADGKRQKPKLTTGAQIEDLRFEAAWWITEGAGWSTGYPAVAGVSLADAVGKHLAGRVGDEPQPLTAEHRAAWCAALDELSQAFQLAAP